jgi:hypothetical protein
MKFPLGRDRVPEMIGVVLADAYGAVASTLPNGATVTHAARSAPMASFKSRRRWSTA